MKKARSGQMPPFHPSRDMTLLERVQAPTPKFFRVLRTIGLTIAGIGGTLLASPVALPAILIQVGGYLTVAGTVITTVSQATVVGDQ